MDFFGKVKSMRIKEYSCEDINNETKQSDKPDNLLSDSEFIINENGLISITKSYDDENNSEGSLESFYDEKNRLVEIKHSFIEDGSFSLITYNYDEFDNMVELIYYVSHEGVIGRTISIYDRKGRIIQQKQFDKGEILITKNFYLYNNKDNTMIINGFNPKGKLIKTVFFRFNKLEKPTEIIISDAKSNIIEKQELEYDSKGNIVLELGFVANTNETFKQVTVYDEFNNVKEFTKYDSNDKIIIKEHIDYDFDSQNNWIKQMVYRDSKLTAITEREICYYE